MRQKPFTSAQVAALARNARLPEEARKPIVKFFFQSATWLISEIDTDGVMFGLCDLGHGHPELGYVALSELQSLRGRWGTGVERDLYFTADKTLAAYAIAAHAHGGIVA